MTAIAQDRPATAPVTAPAPRTALRHPAPPKVRRMTLERWRNWKPADGWKYDWNNGIITKSKKMVSEKQRFIIRNITRAFVQSGYFQQGHDLISECEMAYNDFRYRVPDLAYFTKQQTVAAAKGQHGISAFVVEVISNNDSGIAIEEKMWEYFEHGVQVVWHIWPSLQVVKVYTTPLESKSLIGDMVCSAAPALPDFEMTPNQIFHLEEE